MVFAGACTGDEPEEPEVTAATPTPSPTPDPKCPLTGADAPSAEVAERPAVAVKVENNPVAYPLSGLDEAEVVFEELVEGGVTRFMAIYHCTDAKKVGPVRSARVVDPGIMIPITRILGAAGGNDIVRKALKKAKIVILDEDTSGKAMRRIARSGVSLEHTLFASTAALRKKGSKRFSDPPEVNFQFGPLEGKATKARSIDINFGGSANVGYVWKKGQWQRTDNGSPLMAEGGGQIAVDNVVIEQHTIVNSRTVFDVAGNPSIELADETGKGKALLLRDGKAIKGRWVRKREAGPVQFLTAAGDAMVFAPGTIWVELVPDRKGEIKGSFTVSKK
jgi:hypothetical protein